MNYHISKIIDQDFATAIDKLTEAMKAEGFGIVTEIDIANTFKDKLAIDNYPPHKILGACSPVQAHKILQADPHAGTMLPCNITVREIDGGKIEVSAVNASASLQAIENEEIKKITQEVTTIMQRVIDQL